MYIKKLKPKFKCNIDKGKLKLDNKEAFDAYLLRLNGDYELVVSRPQSIRSRQQNSYLWAVPYKILSDETGHTPEEIHEYLADKFLGFNKLVLDKEVRVVPSTTRLKTMDFEEYLSKIRMWASQDMGCYVPTPNEIDYKGGMV